jgi:hypothetical protein
LFSTFTEKGRVKIWSGGGILDYYRGRRDILNGEQRVVNSAQLLWNSLVDCAPRARNDAQRRRRKSEEGEISNRIAHFPMSN